MTRILQPFPHQRKGRLNILGRVCPAGFTPDDINPVQWLFHPATVLTPCGATVSDYMGDNSRTIHQGQGYLGDGVAYVSIPGLLTGDTITAVLGNPVCTASGRMDIVSGETVYGITVVRGGSIWAFYKCDEGTGTTCFDSSGYSRHGTIVSASSVFFTTQTGFSYRNEYGYSVSGNVYVPRNERARGRDVQGGDLQYPGRARYDAYLVSSYCMYIHTANIVIVLDYNFEGTGLTARFQGTLTGAVSVHDNLIVFSGSGGTCFDLRVYNSSGSVVASYPCAEGAGLMLYDVIGNRHGQISGAVEATLWSQRQNTFHYNIARGYSLYTGAGVNEVYVPYALDGINVITAISGYSLAGHFRAGYYHNGAETQISQPLAPALQVADTGLNYWFSAGVAQSIAYSGITDDVSSAHRIMADVSLDSFYSYKRNIITANSALTGTDLAHMQIYLGQ